MPKKTTAKPIFDKKKLEQALRDYLSSSFADTVGKTLQGRGIAIALTDSAWKPSFGKRVPKSSSYLLQLGVQIVGNKLRFCVYRIQVFEAHSVAILHSVEMDDIVAGIEKQFPRDYMDFFRLIGEQLTTLSAPYLEG